MIKKVVFICGAGHSGSTLLGLVLGSHSQCFYMGEAKKTLYLYNDHFADHKRFCKVCGADCKIWKKWHDSTESGLYNKLDALISEPVVIDSTKDSSWIQDKIHLCESENREPLLIYLKRDGRAVINSRVRKYPQKKVDEQIQQWLTQIQKSQKIYESFHQKKMTIHYQQMTQNPGTVFASLCELLEIPYEDTMLSFFNMEHHPLGGNNGTQSLLNQVKDTKDLQKSLPESKKRYLDHPQAIKYDDRWRTEFSKEHSQIFNKLTGSVNRDFVENQS